MTQNKEAKDTSRYDNNKKKIRKEGLYWELLLKQCGGDEQAAEAAIRKSMVAF